MATKQTSKANKPARMFPQPVEHEAEGKAREPLALEHAATLAKMAHEAARANEAVDIAVGDMSKGLLGDKVSGEALIHVIAIANRAFTASGELSEAGSVAVARAAFIVIEQAWLEEDGKRVNACLDLLREYNGEDKSSLAWRQDILVTVGLAEQKPFGDEVRYVRTEGTTKAAYTGWNNTLARLAPVFMFGYGLWQEMEREAREDKPGTTYHPIAVATVARGDGSKVPRVKVPACLIEESAQGLVVLDGQEKRTIQTARASARQQLGFAKEEGTRNREGSKLNKREAQRAQAQALDAVRKLFAATAFKGMGEGEIKPFAQWDKPLQVFALTLADMLVASGAPVMNKDESTPVKWKLAA